MRNKNFYDYEQATHYLAGSLIRHCEAPVMVSAVDRVNKVILLYIHKMLDDPGDVVRIRSDDSDLDFNPVPLGLTSHYTGKERYGSTLYTCRAPQRASKIGLTHTNLVVSSVSKQSRVGAVLENEDAAQVNRRSILATHDLYNTIMGRYPSYDSVFQKCTNNAARKAFSRRFAIGGEALLYKNYGQVGEALKDGPKLSEDFHYLQQALQEDLQ